MSQTSRAELEAEIEAFQREHLRRMSKRQVKREIIQLLRSKEGEDLSVADVSMELQTPMQGVVRVLVELEAEGWIQPVIDALCGEEEERVRLNPDFTTPKKKKRGTASGHDVKAVLSKLQDRCFVFEAGRMRAYEIMLSGDIF